MLTEKCEWKNLRRKCVSHTCHHHNPSDLHWKHHPDMLQLHNNSSVCIFPIQPSNVSSSIHSTFYSISFVCFAWLHSLLTYAQSAFMNMHKSQHSYKYWSSTQPALYSTKKKECYIKWRKIWFPFCSLLYYISVLKTEQASFPNGVNVTHAFTQVRNLSPKILKN